MALATGGGSLGHWVLTSSMKIQQTNHLVISFTEVDTLGHSMQDSSVINCWFLFCLTLQSLAEDYYNSVIN